MYRVFKKHIVKHKNVEMK